MARIIPTGYPDFTYTGTVEKAWDSEWGWYLIFKSGGTLKFTQEQKIDVFLCGGGGGGGGSRDNAGGGGGGGGYTTTAIGTIKANAGQEYAIVVGGGGKGGTSEGNGGAGGASSAFGKSASGGGAGGAALNNAIGGPGGSGTGKGADGGSETYGTVAGGNGVRPFGSYGSVYYGAGGGGGSGSGGGASSGGTTGGGRGGDKDDNGTNGTANTGGGGGGGGRSYVGGSSGGSGIVIIRNSEITNLPVNFKGTTLLKMFFNGEEVQHLIHNGKQLFMEGMNAWRSKHLMRSALAAR